MRVRADRARYGIRGGDTREALRFNFFAQRPWGARARRRIVTVASRRVLVTGAGGFIGSHLAERLVREGAQVRAFVHYNSRGDRGWLDRIPAETARQIDFFAGDLKDPQAVRRAVADSELVFHLGALIAIPYSYVNPLDFVQTNVLGTAHVLEACREIGVERLVHTSTSEVYGTAQRAPIDETHPLVGQSPYAASKIGADQLAESYRRSFGVPVATARPFNVFGPRQSARAVVAAIAVQCLAGGPVRLGSLRPTRDLTYVDDTVDGFLRLATAPGAVGEVVNLGSGREISIGALAETIAKLVDVRVSIVEDESRVRPANSEVGRLQAGVDKARELLGWQARVELEEGLLRTIRWLESNRELYDDSRYAI